MFQIPQEFLHGIPTDFNISTKNMSQKFAFDLLPKKKSKGQSYYENLNVVILLANQQPCKRPLARKKKLMSFLLNCLLLQRPHVDIPNACTVAAKWTWDGQKRVFLVQQCLPHFQ